MASAAWRKWAGVPVERRVAAILRAMMPLLPMPVTTMRPRPVGGLKQQIGRLGEGGEHGAVEAESELAESGGFDADELRGAEGV